MRRIMGLMLVVLLCGLGCKNAYYGTMEKFGYEKRDILASRVEDARNDQVKARDQFKTTLQRFQELTGLKGGDLDTKYKSLNSEYEDCKSRADDVTGRINKVDAVAQDMFQEWKQEITQYDSADLRRQSEDKLRQSQDRYRQLLAIMRQSEQSMQPVLRAFHDQVMFLKHNLNAEAIASLQGTSVSIQTDVTALIAQMDRSIAEADKFISTMREKTAK